MFIYRAHNMIIKMLYALYKTKVQQYFTQNPTFINCPHPSYNQQKVKSYMLFQINAFSTSF